MKNLILIILLISTFNVVAQSETRYFFNKRNIIEIGIGISPYLIGNSILLVNKQAGNYYTLDNVQEKERHFTQNIRLGRMMNERTGLSFEGNFGNSISKSFLGENDKIESVKFKTREFGLVASVFQYGISNPTGMCHEFGISLTQLRMNSGQKIGFQSDSFFSDDFQTYVDNGNSILSADINLNLVRFSYGFRHRWSLNKNIGIFLAAKANLSFDFFSEIFFDSASYDNNNFEARSMMKTSMNFDILNLKTGLSFFF